MKNKILIIITFFLIISNTTFLNATEEFNFDVTQIEILNDGNLIKGNQRGNITSIDKNLTITADTFEYDRIENILSAQGNVILKDEIKNFIIESNHISYFKNSEKIISKNKTKAFLENKYTIFSENVIINYLDNEITSGYLDLKKT